MRAGHAVSALCIFATALGALSGQTSSWERDPTCTYAHSDQIKALTEAWTKAIAAGDIEAVTQLYSPDAILMGLQETSVKIGHLEIAEHYSRLMRSRFVFTPVSRTIESECSTAQDSGMQSVSARLLSGATDPAPAIVRYNMMYAYGEKRWLIIHHHIELEGAASVPDVAQKPAPTPPVSTGSLTTGSIPEKPASVDRAIPSPAQAQALRPIADIVIPETPYHLPSAPPVILSPTLRLILAPGRPVEPALVPEVKAEREMTPSAASVAATAAPALQFPAMPKPFEPLLPLPVKPVAASSVVAPIEVGVVVPKPFADAGYPVVAPTIAPMTQPKAAVATTPPPAKTAIIAAPAPAAKAPVVAGFTQRAAVERPAITKPQPSKAASTPPPAAPKVAIAAAPRPKSKAVPTAAPEPSSGYKAGRWVHDVPVFDP